MGNTFKDHFSHDSASYARNRPGYPDSLFSHLASLCPSHGLAWDCATGTGQSAIKLTEHFERVVATDASSAQIGNAAREPRISYHVATAENSGIRSHAVDLIAVSQALHWFDLETFSDEVERTLKPGGILAAWTYRKLAVTPEIDSPINRLYREILKNYWPPERRLVDEGYQAIEMPFEELESPAFFMHASWNVEHLLDYMSTWSAVHAYRRQQGSDPVDLIRDEVYLASKMTGREFFHVKWPLAIRVWRNS